MFTERRTDGSLQCLLCPNLCVIPEGGSGRCGVRVNLGGELHLPFRGTLSAVSSDPVEKKPLYHYYPGRRIFSVGFFGCSLLCPFCQNYTISRQTPDSPSPTLPRELEKHALASGSFGIAYTYSEPLIHFEYLMEAAELARAANLKNVLVTNGYLNEEPARALLPLIDAANIDLKSFNPGFYRRELGGKLESVTSFIAIAAPLIHVEITTLVIPGKTDAPEEIDEIARFIGSIDSRIPLHLSCYHPMYRYRIPPTPAETVLALAARAKRFLHHVYPGNIGPREPVDTFCEKCGALLVRRRGYDVRIQGIHDGRCTNCGHPSPCVGA